MATTSNISSFSQNAANLATQNVPDLATAQSFGAAITDLLKQYQKIEKYPYALQGINAQQQQVNRMQTTDPGLIGASPDLQSSVRSASVQAVQPTVSGAEQAGQTFASRLSTFADVMNSAQNIQSRMEAGAQQAKADAMNLINNSMANFGPDAFKTVSPDEVARLEKLAGVPSGYIKQVSATIKAREAAALAREDAKFQQQLAASRPAAAKMQAATGANGEMLTFNPNNGKYYNLDGSVYSGAPTAPELGDQTQTTAPLTLEEKMANAGVVRTKTGPGYGFTLNGNPVDYLTAAQAIGLQANDAGQLLFGSTNAADRKAINAAVPNYNLQNKKNAGVTQATAVPSGYKQYGLLATTDFNPSNPSDKLAKQYLDYYIKNAAIPTAYNLGLGRSVQSAAKFTDAANRAQSLFYQAAGYSLPDVNVLKGNKALVNINNKILNNQAILSDTIIKNFDLAIKGEIKNNVNKNATIVNRILNPIYLALGDPAVNQALVSNGTITQEFANLIAIRNQGGTLAADKAMGEELIKFGTSVEAQKAVVERLKQEAANIHSALLGQNTNLYAEIDPLEQSPQNPNRVTKLKGGSTSSIFSTNQSDPLGLFK